MALVKPSGQVHASVHALPTQVKATQGSALQALVASPSDGVQPTCITPHAAAAQTLWYTEGIS